MDDKNEQQPLELHGISNENFLLSGRTNSTFCLMMGYFPSKTVGLCIVQNNNAQQNNNVYLEAIHKIAGTLVPKDGKQAGQQGVKLSKFGPIQSWSVKHTGDTHQVCEACASNRTGN